jgi:hypothetical protein
MSNLGIGVMLSSLGGNRETVEALTSSLNKTIKDLSLNDDILLFKFNDGTKLQIFDDGQSCCESRYMRTDDNLTEFIGAKLISAELKSAPDVETEYDVHEVQFLEINTDKGSFVMSSHNEHNGYYGGFAIVCRL